MHVSAELMHEQCILTSVKSKESIGAASGEDPVNMLTQWHPVARICGNVYFVSSITFNHNGGPRQLL